MTKNIYLIMGSVRAGRLCPKITDWIATVARSASPFAYQVIDLQEWHLPMNDEAGIPAQSIYSCAHTQAWSRKIAAADGIIFVTPQYNWGYPAPLKNAIDHLYAEWKGKPAVIVSYGGHGGGKCAAQLKQVLEGIGMQPVPTMPGLNLKRETIAGGPLDPETDFAEAAATVEQAIRELLAAFAE